MKTKHKTVVPLSTKEFYNKVDWPGVKKIKLTIVRLAMKSLGYKITLNQEIQLSQAKNIIKLFLSGDKSLHDNTGMDIELLQAQMVALEAFTVNKKLTDDHIGILDGVLYYFDGIQDYGIDTLGLEIVKESLLTEDE